MITLHTTEDIEQAVRERGTMPVHFPSGRSTTIRYGDDTLISRSRRWLAQYTVATDGFGLILDASRFDFTSNTNRNELNQTARHHTNQIRRSQELLDSVTAELERLSAPSVSGPTLEDLQNIDWPELIHISQRKNIGMPWSLDASFIHVLFHSRESVAISSNIRMQVTRDLRWKPSEPAVHPHVNITGTAICPGNIQELF